MGPALRRSAKYPETTASTVGRLHDARAEDDAWSIKVAALHLDLSRICAAPSARLGHFPFEGDRAFP
ncbi:MAG: hypothetical protein ACEPO2_12895, partial [Pelagibaca sp.]